MTTVHLTAMRADNPIGFLAALGVMSLLERSCAPIRMGWDADAGGVAVLDGPMLTSADAVTEALVQAWQRRDLDAEFGWSADVVLGSEGAARPFLEAGDVWGNADADLDEQAARLRAACVAELPVRNGRPPYTPFRLIPHVGRTRFLASALAESRRVTPTDLERVIFGPWEYVKTNALRLDPAARLQVRALMAGAPTHVGSLGVKGAMPLAMRGLTYFPLQIMRSGATCAGWMREQFVWPVWDEPISAGVIRMLLSAPWLTDTSRDGHAAAEAHGVTRRLRAVRQRLGSDGAVLTAGEPLIREERSKHRRRDQRR